VKDTEEKHAVLIISYGISYATYSSQASIIFFGFSISEGSEQLSWDSIKVFFSY